MLPLVVVTGGVDVHVAAAAGDEVAVGGGDRRVDIDVAERVEGQRRRHSREAVQAIGFVRC